MFPSARPPFEQWIRSVNEARRRGGLREQHLAGDVYLRISDHRTADGGLVSVFTDITDLRAREREDIGGHRRQITAFKRGVESGGIVADEFYIVHSLS